MLAKVSARRWGIVDVSTLIFGAGHGAVAGAVVGGVVVYWLGRSRRRGG